MLSVFYNFYLRILPERSEGVGEHERNENNVHVRVRANKQKNKTKILREIPFVIIILDTQAAACLSYQCTNIYYRLYIYILVL